MFREGTIQIELPTESQDRRPSASTEVLVLVCFFSIHFCLDLKYHSVPGRIFFSKKSSLFLSNEIRVCKTEAVDRVL